MEAAVGYWPELLDIPEVGCQAAGLIYGRWAVALRGLAYLRLATGWSRLGSVSWSCGGLWASVGVLPQAMVSSMMPISFPAGMASTAIPAHAQNSHHACTMIATPPAVHAPITIATSSQEDGLPCRWPAGGTCRSSTCSQG